MSGGERGGGSVRWLKTVAWFLVVGWVFVSGAPADVSAQSLYGTLLERGTDRPVDLALITLLTLEGDSVAAVLTDEAGEFQLHPAVGGRFRLAVSALGYRSTVSSAVISLPPATSVSLQFRVEPQPIEIGGVTVEARPSLERQPALVKNGFVQRATRGFGRFITPMDVEESRAPRVSDLLVRTGGVTTRWAITGERLLMRASRGYCTPSVYLNGFRMDLTGTSIDAMVSMTEVEAVEVYRTAVEVPPRFGGGMVGCGAVVVWTKGRAG